MKLRKMQMVTSCLSERKVNPNVWAEGELSQKGWGDARPNASHDLCFRNQAFSLIDPGAYVSQKVAVQHEFSCGEQSN